MEDEDGKFIVGSPEAAAVLAAEELYGNFFIELAGFHINTGKAITPDGNELMIIDYELMEDDEIIKEVAYLKAQPNFVKTGEIYIEATDDIIEQYNVDLATIEGRYAPTH